MRIVRELLETLRRDLGALVRGGGGGAPPLFADRGVRLTALALLVGSFLLYLPLGLQVVEGEILERHNQVFDLDPGRFVDLFAGDDWDETTFAVDVRVKHPGILVLRPLVKGFLLFGAGPKPTCTLLVLLAGALTVVCMQLFLLHAGVRPLEAALLSALFAVSSAQMTAAAIVESYGFAALTVGWLHVVTVRRLEHPDAHPRARLLHPVLTFAITSTNVLQAFAAELVVWLKNTSVGRAALRLAAFSLLMLVPMTVGGMVALDVGPVELAKDPALLVKQPFWVGSLEEETPKAPVWKQLHAYFGLAFVAPEPTVVPIAQEGRSWEMLDFREHRFTALGGVAYWGWTFLLLTGLAFVARTRRFHPTATVLLLCVLSNVVIHMIFQYRQSLYLITPHLHLLVVGLLAPLGTWASAGTCGRRAAFALYVVTLAVLMGWNNLAQHREVFAVFG